MKKHWLIDATELDDENRVFDTREEAIQAAEDIARLYPGEEIPIYESIMLVYCPRPEIKKEEL